MIIQSDFQFKYPPDQKISLKHKLATRIWRGITSQKTQVQTCQCCGRKVGNQIFQSKCIHNSSQFSFLGPGIPLFFKFLKYSVILLIFFSLFFSIYGIYSNISSQNCQKDSQCTLTIFNSLSIVNKKRNSEYMLYQNYIVLAFVCSCFIILQIYRYLFRKVEYKIDEIDISASDYSIILKRLPANITQDKIKNMVQDYIQKINQKIKIQKIILSYDLTNYHKQKSKLLQLFQNHVDQQLQFKPTDHHIDKPTTSGLIAVVVFESQSSKKFFIHQSKFYQRLIQYFFSPFTALSDFQIDNSHISIERAPEPDDILWENAHITPYERMKRKILLNCISIILLFAGGACQYGLALCQIYITDPTQKTLVGTAASILVTITNYILQIFLIHFTKWELMSTQTEYLDILTLKLTLQQFLNSGVFVILANILADIDNFTLENNLSQTITQIMILNALTPNFSTFFMKKFDLVGRIKRYLFIQKKLFFFTQLQANKLYELPKPDFPQKYSFIIKTLWLTALYAPFCPIVVPISAIGLVIYLFVQKNLFSDSYSITNKIGSILNNNCMESLQYIPLILSLGQFFIYFYLDRFYFTETPNGWLAPIYICLALSFSNLILPMKQLNEGIQQCLIQNSQISPEQQVPKRKSTKKLQTQQKYSEALERFEIGYQMTNPAYQTKKSKRKDTIVQFKIESLFRNSKVSKVESRKNVVGGVLALNELIQQKQSNQNQIENKTQELLIKQATQQQDEASFNEIKHANQSLSSLIKVTDAQKKENKIARKEIGEQQTMIQQWERSDCESPSILGIFGPEPCQNDQDTHKQDKTMLMEKKKKDIKQIEQIHVNQQRQKKNIIVEGQRQLDKVKLVDMNSVKRLFQHQERKATTNKIIEIAEQSEQEENTMQRLE